MCSSNEFLISTRSLGLTSKTWFLHLPLCLTAPSVFPGPCLKRITVVDNGLLDMAGRAQLAGIVVIVFDL